MAAPIVSLLDAFGRIDDPRKARGLRHPFTSILTLTFLGLLCRQTDFASLQRWAADNWRTLKGSLGFTRKKPPHATTISRAVAGFSLEQFRDAFAAWLVTLPQAAQAGVASADGKTSKQGHDAQGDPIHMLNIFAHELGLSLAQFPVTDGKPTEPQALKAALAELIDHYPLLRLFTADALFMQRPLAQAILDAGRDFLFAVKDNQPALLEAIQTSFQEVAAQPPDVETKEKKSGEIHTRKLWIIEGEEVDYIREATAFPGLKMILRVDFQASVKGAPIRQETRYLATSLSPDEVSPERLMRLVRGHWCVENGLHFLKDRWWDEDRQWSIRAGLAERLASLRNAALTALRLIPGLPEDMPIRARADHLGRKVRKALRFIGALV
jgi:predicted transposase YbfD/YdcC